MAIIYVRGDLLNATQPWLVQQCNAQATMGSGVAKAIRDKYPNVYDDYVNTFELMPKSKRMGQINLTKIDDTRAVCNIISQYHYLPRGIRHTDYEALKKGFTQLKDLTVGQDLAMPKIGCGLGGGDWNVVSNIIETIFDDRDVYIYEI